MDFYTFFQRHKSEILLSGYENGQKVNKKIKLKPYLFFPTEGESKYKTINGNPVKRVDFDSPWEASKFVKEYEDIENFDMYGSTYYDYVWVNDYFKDIKSDNNKLRIGNYDIETDSEGGFADIDTADKEITSISISVMFKKHIYCLGLKDYDPSASDRLKEEIPDKVVKYKKCANERELLETFIELWQKLKFDCITGWNISGYDHVYMIRRIRRILGENVAKKLSPYGIIKSHTFEKFGKTIEQFEIVGIPTIDYLDAYKKFSFKNVESYKLDYISHLELKKKKLDYSKYRTLARLYKENSDLFYDYNVIDIVRVENLEDKLKFIDLIFSLAHFTKTNALDGFATVKPCDVVIHNTLMRDNIVVPFPKSNEDIYRQIAGGYVKHPKPGFYKYVLSFDLTSLYPFLIQAFNISPDVYLGKLDQYDNLGSAEMIMEGEYDKHRENLLKENVCLSPKGTLFSREKQGIFALIMEEGFKLRKQQKDEMLKYKKLKSETGDDKYDALITEYHNKQLATKIFLNAFYGGLANPYSRWFSYDIAETITLSGQLVTKWIESEMNAYFNKIMKTKDKEYVLAADTDSCYINVTSLIERVFPDGGTQEEITEFLENFAKEIEDKAIDVALAKLYKATNIFKPCLHMKMEAVGQAVWRATKQYIMSVWSMEGVRYKTPEIKMQGIEAVRSSTPEICRDYIKNSLKFIVEQNKSGLMDHINTCKEEFYSMPFDKVAMPRGVSDVGKWVDTSTSLKPYIKGVPYHVRAAITYNNYITKNKLTDDMPVIQNGDKMRLSYMLMPNPVKENVFACPDELPKEFNLDEYIDYPTQFEKTFLKPITSLAQAAGISMDNKIDMEQFEE